MPYGRPLKLDTADSCDAVYDQDGIVVKCFLQGSRAGQHWAIHKQTGIDARGETIPSAIMALRIKMRGWGVEEQRTKKPSPLVAGKGRT